MESATAASATSSSCLHRGLCAHLTTFTNLTILRYIKVFDNDRLGLEGAYAPGATFSCRFIPSPRSSPPHYFTKCNTGTQPLLGPSSIIQTLSSFSRQITFVPESGYTLDAEVFALQLPDTSYFTTLTFNTIVEGASLSVDMVFLLKERTRLSGKQDMSRVLWTPFVVMSHQIILRS